MAGGLDIWGSWAHEDHPKTRHHCSGGGLHIIVLKHVGSRSWLWPCTAPFASWNCILKALSPCILATKTVRFWTSRVAWVQVKRRNSDLLQYGAARHWLPYRLWRELSAQPQSGYRQSASLAALGTVWLEQLQVSLFQVFQTATMLEQTPHSSSCWRKTLVLHSLKLYCATLILPNHLPLSQGSDQIRAESSAPGGIDLSLLSM